MSGACVVTGATGDLAAATGFVQFRGTLTGSTGAGDYTARIVLP